VIVGGWVHRLPPLPGELLSSCLARNALAHGTSPMRFLSMIWPGEQPWCLDIDRDLRGLRPRSEANAGRDWPDMLANALRVPHAIVLDATLDGFRKRLVGRTPNARGRTPLVLSAGVADHKRKNHVLQFCPGCLAEGVPHFRREWRLAFVVCCPRHGLPLQDACPWCGAGVAPHRTATARITDCQSCLRPLAGPPGAAGRQVPAPATALQARLMAILLDVGPAAVGPWTDRAAFDGVRCLTGLASIRMSHRALREGLGLAQAALPSDRCLFVEDLRADARAVILETVAAWLADWPEGFHRGVVAAGFTQRTFARLRMPPALAAEVARLREGRRRDNAWRPLLEEPVLKRLRRRDPARYRAVRAERIAGHIEAEKARRATGRGWREQPRMAHPPREGRHEKGAADGGGMPFVMPDLAALMSEHGDDD